MPRYDYFCESCKETFEVTQSIHDPEFTIHNKAESCTCYGKLARLISSGIAVIFKGPGWSSKGSLNKIDRALDTMGVEDASGGWSKSDGKESPKKKKKLARKIGELKVE